MAPLEVQELDLNNSGELVAEMLTILKPGLRNASPAGLQPIKMKIVLSSKRRWRRLLDRVEKMDGQKKLGDGNQPVCDLRG